MATRAEDRFPGEMMGVVRFLLALSVVATHSRDATIFGIPLLGGVVAVQCFYVISGFLITMVINEKADYRSPSNFYVSRYLRLWPVYAVVALLSLVVYQWPLFADLTAIATWPSILFIAFSNLTIFFQDWFLFLRFDNGQLVPTAAWPLGPEPYVVSFLVVPQCWTLGVELTFYAVAPFFSRSFPRILMLCLAGLLVRGIVAWLQPPTLDPWVYRFAPSEMMLFGAGGVAYFIGRASWQRWPRYFSMVGRAALVCWVVLVLDYGSPKVDHLIFSAKSLLLESWTVIAWMVLTVPLLFRASMGSRIDAFVGELSYPMYVCHFLVGRAVGWWVPETWQRGNVLYAVLVILFSVVLLVCISQPVDAWRRRFGASVSRSPAAARATS